MTRTNIMGVYKIPGFGKDVDPESIIISCAKDGYKETNVCAVRAPAIPKTRLKSSVILQKE